MPPLTEDEKDELQRAVSMLGRDWRAVAAAGVCGVAPEFSRGDCRFGAVGGKALVGVVAPHCPLAQAQLK